jgi:integrase
MVKVKPDKPYPDFPLFPHGNGQWCKTIRGKQRFFGVWADWEAALERYLDERDDWYAGRTPTRSDEMTVGELMSRFLSARKASIESGELTQRTWQEYKSICDDIIGFVGKTVAVSAMMPDDFARLRAHFAKGVGPTTLGNKIRRARVAFRFIEEITGNLPRWGKSFQEPSKKTARKHRTEKGDQSYAAEEIREFIESAKNPQLKAMIYLGINCGFGNMDCATLTWKSLDLVSGWHNHPRPKTGVARRGKLWAETLALLAEIERQQVAKERVTEICFVTRYNKPWVRQSLHGKESWIDSIAQESRKIGLEFYRLRRTFRTIADEVQDTLAARLIMGHTAPGHDMDAVYVQSIGDVRLQVIADRVRDWLNPSR